jgi:hypothetical protein
MSNAATRSGPVAASVSATLNDFVRTFAGMFEITRPADRERLVHRLLLVIILSVGTLVRFWGLGDVGLHGDEDTMALAVLHILQDGRPILPSGLFYPRGFTELYMMAGSVLIFGPTEWAFRFPSALCGVVLILLSYLAGRRFLRPQWNLAFAATVALLPEIVVYSQTARMYVFMLTAVAVAMVCIFEWERSDRRGWLIGAVVALLIGIELHALAVTTALLFFLPGVLQGDVRKLAYAAGAAAVVFVGFVFIDGWVNAQYPVPPSDYGADIAPPGWRGSRVLDYPLEFDIAVIVASVGAAFFAVHLGRKFLHKATSLVLTTLLLAGLVAQLALFYHLAALLILAGFVLGYRRIGTAMLRRSWMFTLAAGAIALIQVTVLAARPGSVVKLVGAMVGQPSVWPYVRMADFSLMAALLACGAALWGLWRFANRERIDDYSALALFGVWIPLFVLGLFVWNMPPRYTAASLLPLLLSAFAFAQRGVDWLSQTFWSSRALHAFRAVAALLAVGLIVNPLSATARINSGYSTHPDHKGAAAFMRAQQIEPRDIIIAEDVQQQKYYLGEVDYWLMSRKHARRYVQDVKGELRDFYTGSLVIDSGAQLAALLERYPDRRIFIVGSGENQADQRREMRGFGIFEMLHSDRFEVLYVGRDGFTRVWRARTPAPASRVLPRDDSGHTAGPSGTRPRLAARSVAASAE